MITIRDLCFQYKKKQVFNGLSLTLQSGYIYGLLGKNGAGKSTLLRNMIGTLFPRKGSVEVLGYAPGKRQPEFLQQAFMVAEEIYLPNVSVDKFVRFNAPFYPRFDTARFKEYLTAFEIPVKNTLQQMSYGQKKKVLISFGLACNTALLLMDEPTNGLDITSKDTFRKIITACTSEHKCIIISTHQVKDLESLIDRVTILDDGGIIFDQTLDSIHQKLLFTISQTAEQLEHALYHEPLLHGYAAVVPNSGNNDSKADLELLYKTVIRNPLAVNAVFSSSVHTNESIL